MNPDPAGDNSPDSDSQDDVDTTGASLSDSTSEDSNSSDTDDSSSSDSDSDDASADDSNSDDSGASDSSDSDSDASDSDASDSDDSDSDDSDSDDSDSSDSKPEPEPEPEPEDVDAKDGHAQASSLQAAGADADQNLNATPVGDPVESCSHDATELSTPAPAGGSSPPPPPVPGDLLVIVEETADHSIKIKDANVQLAGPESPNGKSQPDGTILFHAIASGAYTITVTHPCYQQGSATATVPPNGKATAEVPLQKVDPKITIGRVMRGNPYVPRNASAADGMADSVPPSKTYEVQVTVDPPLTACSRSIALSIVNGSADNGTATISPATISSTTTVTITGGSQTKAGHGGNLKIQAKLDGAVKAESAGFTVCAHPINYRDTLAGDVDEPGGVGVRVQDDWDSDSGSFADLVPAAGEASPTKIKELVRQGTRDAPPFKALSATRIRNSDYLDGHDKTIDTHSEPRPAKGPAGKAQKLQLCIFKCFRCGETDKVQPNSGFEILHSVFQDGAGVWKHHTTKTGAAADKDGFTSGPGVASVTSVDHTL